MGFTFFGLRKKGKLFRVNMVTVIQTTIKRVREKAVPSTLVYCQQGLVQ